MRFLFLLILTGTLAAQTPRSEEAQKQQAMDLAKTLLAMPDAEADAAIQKLSVAEVQAAQTNIMQIARTKYKDITKVNFLANHLAQMRATEREQRRLNNLVYVIVFTLLLFSGYLTYVLLQQRRMIRTLALLGPAETLPPSALEENSTVREASRKPSRPATKKKSRK